MESIENHDVFENWLQDFGKIALRTHPPKRLYGIDQYIDRVVADFRRHYEPLIPEMVRSFPGWISVLREAVFARIRKECLLPRDTARWRKIILHPLLVVSIDSSVGRVCLPVTFTAASDRRHAIRIDWSWPQWILSFSVNDTPHGFVTCPSPKCLVGSYTYPDHIVTHL